MKKKNIIWQKSYLQYFLRLTGEKGVVSHSDQCRLFNQDVLNANWHSVKKIKQEPHVLIYYRQRNQLTAERITKVEQIYAFI